MSLGQESWGRREVGRPLRLTCRYGRFLSGRQGKGWKGEQGGGALTPGKGRQLWTSHLVTAATGLLEAEREEASEERAEEGQHPGHLSLSGLGVCG